MKVTKMSTDTNSAPNNESKNSPHNTSCRGCTYECKNYAMCDSKLWRMTDTPRANAYKFFDENP